MISEHLLRVEGEGEVVVYVDESGVARRVEYRFTEAPRFFEYIVRGLHYTQVPDMVSRICGFCGVSYTLCAARAFESCLGIQVDERVERYRDLVHLAERVKSHVLHVAVMNLPDLVGARSIIEVGRFNTELFKLSASLFSAVDKLMRLAGGRFHNVVNIRVGGVFGEPRELGKLVKYVREELFPSFEKLAERVLEIAESTRDRGWVPEECTVASSKYPGSGVALYVGGEHFPADLFYERLVGVFQKPGSTTLRYRYREEPFIVGPLPRFNRYKESLRSETREFLEKYGWFRPLDSVYQSVVARIAEAYDALLTIEDTAEELSTSTFSTSTQLPGPGSEKQCFHVIEAPRGVLYMLFTLDGSGLVARSNIVTPTAQNVEAAEELACRTATGLPATEAAAIAKRLIVNFDPCISCSVHTLPVRFIKWRRQHERA